jgi:hypothetical protein
LFIEKGSKECFTSYAPFVDLILEDHEALAKHRHLEVYDVAVFVTVCAISQLSKKLMPVAQAKHDICSQNHKNKTP